MIGLLPISMGSMIRVPWSVATLMWLHATGVQESFATTPWPETDLGRFLDGRWSRSLRRGVGTIGRLGLWSLLCTVLLIATILCYVVPFGPSQYHVIDQSAHSVHGIVKGWKPPEPKLLVGVVASGYGSAMGLYPATHIYRCNSVRLTASNGNTSRTVNILLGPTLWMESTNSRVEFTANSCRTFLIEATGQDWPDHAEKLFMAINQLYSRPTPEFRRALYAPSLDAAAEMSVAEQFRDNAARFMGSNGIRPLPNYVTFASRLDPNLFRVESTEANQIGTGGCSVIATWFAITLGIGSILVWSLGAWWIVSKRHRQPQAILTKAAASST